MKMALMQAETSDRLRRLRHWCTFLDCSDALEILNIIGGRTMVADAVLSGLTLTEENSNVLSEIDAMLDAHASMICDALDELGHGITQHPWYRQFYARHK